jgi:gas vesicle protein
MKMCHLIAFAGGMLVGGTVALLFAPKKGEELRMDIKRKMGAFKDGMAGNACKDGCCGSDKVDVTIEE